MCTMSERWSFFPNGDGTCAGGAKPVPARDRHVALKEAPTRDRLRPEKSSELPYLSDPQAVFTSCRSPWSEGTWHRARRQSPLTDRVSMIATRAAPP